MQTFDLEYTKSFYYNLQKLKDMKTFEYKIQFDIP